MKYEDKKRQLNQKLRLRLKKEEMNTRSFHSHSYHRFFENYKEKSVTGENGKRKIIRTYVGPVYRQELSASRYILLRLLYIFLFAVMTWLMILTGMSGRASDSTWYMAVAELVTILFLSFMGYTLLTGYLFVPRQMTVGDYNESSRSLMWKAAGVGICFSIDAAFVLLYILLYGNRAGAADWKAAGTFLAGAVIALSIWLLEKHIPYQVTEGLGQAEEDGGIEILYHE